MRKSLVTGLSGLALTLLPLAASAHPGHQMTYSFSTGFVHPFTGLDHLLAMLAVGFAASRMGRRGFWMPVAFMSWMLVGAGAGVAGFAMPGLETGIALSVLMLGLIMMAARQMPTLLGVGLTAAFAFFHGCAHGSEMPSGAHVASFFAGFTLATATLHLIGMGIGRAASRSSLQWLTPAAGLGTVGAGALMLFGLA